MRPETDCRQLIAVVGSYGRNRCDYGQLLISAGKVGLRGDGAFVARLDRVMIELLLREHMTSAAAREEVIPRLLRQRVLLSWWRPKVCVTPEPDSWTSVTDGSGVLCAVLVPSIVKIWVMEALTGWES